MYKNMVSFKKLVNDKNIEYAEKTLYDAIMKYPNSETLKYYYAIVLNKKGDIEKAIYYLEQINNCYSVGSCYEMIKSYIYMGNYEDALGKLDQLSDILNRANYVNPFYKEMLEKGYILCLDKLEILNYDYKTSINRLNPYLKQTLNYDSDYAIEFITRTRNKSLKNNLLTFDESMSIKDLYMLIKKELETGKMIHTPCSNMLDDVYYFNFPGINSMNDRSVDLLIVPVIRGTTNIFTMLPGTSQIDSKYINYIDLDCITSKGKKLIKTHSQIEKFNKKYNL